MDSFGAGHLFCIAQALSQGAGTGVIIVFVPQNGSLSVAPFVSCRFCSPRWLLGAEVPLVSQSSTRHLLLSCTR